METRPRFYDDVRLMVERVFAVYEEDKAGFGARQLWRGAQRLLGTLADPYETTRDTFERLHEGVLALEILVRGFWGYGIDRCREGCLAQFLRLRAEHQESFFGMSIESSANAELLKVLRVTELVVRTSAVQVIAPEERFPPGRNAARQWFEKLQGVCGNGAAENYEALCRALLELRGALLLTLDQDLPD